MTKSIVLCADDYGQAPAISQGILSLLEKQRLSATSCLVTSDNWQEHASWLKPYENKADLGLHFNLTEGKPLSSAFTNTYGDLFFSLPILMARSMVRQLNQAVIQAECIAQIDRFSQAMGFLPHFIDGHQHVHQFPVVRQAVIGAYMASLSPNRAYVRWVNPQYYASDFFINFKKIVICKMGTVGFQQLLLQEQIPHNSYFSGIYPFKGSYASHFCGFLNELGDRGILMCHPALEGGAKDPLAQTRWNEYQYLISPEFLRDCARFNVKIERF